MLTKEDAVPMPRTPYTVPRHVRLRQAWREYGVHLLLAVVPFVLFALFWDGANVEDRWMMIGFGAIIAILTAWGIYFTTRHTALTYVTPVHKVKVMLAPGAHDAYIPPRVLDEKISAYLKLWEDAAARVAAGELDDPDGVLGDFDPHGLLQSIIIEGAPLDAERPNAPEQVAYGKAHPLHGRVFLWKERSQHWPTLEYEIGNILSVHAGMPGDELAWARERERLGVLHT